MPSYGAQLKLARGSWIDRHHHAKPSPPWASAPTISVKSITAVATGNPGQSQVGAEDRSYRPAICHEVGMPETKKDRQAVLVPRPKDAPKRPRIPPRAQPIPTTDEPEAPLPDRGVAPGITG